MAPSAAPAPTRLWISSMNRMMSPRSPISFMTFLRRSSNSPRYFEPATRRAQVERVDLLVLEQAGHVVLGDALGQALDHGGLAHAGLAHQHRVVLGAAGQDLHDPLDLGLATDDRVELVFFGVLGEVAAELVEHLGALALLALGRFRARRGTAGRPAAGTGQHPHDFLAHPVGVDIQVVEDARRHALALAHEAQQDVLGADVVVAQRKRLAQRQFEDLLRPGREGDLALRLVIALAHDAGDLAAHLFQADLQGAQHPRGHAVGLAQEAQEEVLRADVVVAQHPRLFLSQDYHLSGSFCEPFKHHFFLLSPDARAREHLAQDPGPYLVYLGAI